MKRPVHGRSAKSAPTVQVPVHPLKVFIGYADLDAVRRSTATVAAAARASSRRVEILPLLWRFEQLAASHWRDRAITAALDADIVVLASSHASALKPEIEAWIAAFLKALQGRRMTLVVISGPAEAWTISLETPPSRTASDMPAVREELVA